MFFFPLLLKFSPAFCSSPHIPPGLTNILPKSLYLLGSAEGPGGAYKEEEASPETLTARKPQRLAGESCVPEFTAAPLSATHPTY